MVWDDVERVRRALPGGRAGPRARPLPRAPALRRADRPASACASPSRARSTPPSCSTGRRARPSRWSPTCASWSPRSRSRTCARCSSACSARARRRGSSTAARRRPSTTTRPTEHGLLEHCLSVAQGVSAISATFPGIDRDVAVTGALLHDIGKLEAYTTDPAAIDLTDAGRLQGEIPLGYYRIRREIEEIEGFPPRLAEALLHIILSHHGQLEHGSPVVPCTREATLVHFLDNLGGRLGSFDRLEKELPVGAAWSSFDRALGSSAFFGSAGTRGARVAA